MAAADTGGEDRVAKVREAVGVFHDRNSFQAAVDELLNSGFDRADLGLLASTRAVEEKLGHLYEKVSELEDDPRVPRAAFIGRDSMVEGRTGIVGGLAYIGALAAIGAVVASGGTLAWTIAAAVVAGGGGGLLGGVAARWLGRERAKTIQDQLDHGGLLLWVRLRDVTHERRAVDILRMHSAADVHVHELPVAAVPEADPLAGFEPDPFLPKARI
jgi:hypothetical protein